MPFTVDFTLTETFAVTGLLMHIIKFPQIRHRMENFPPVHSKGGVIFSRLKYAMELWQVQC